MIGGSDSRTELGRLCDENPNCRYLGEINELRDATEIFPYGRYMPGGVIRYSERILGDDAEKRRGDACRRLISLDYLSACLLTPEVEARIKVVRSNDLPGSSHVLLSER